jgi:hypothetical protein
MEGAEMSQPNPFHLLLGRAIADPKFQKELLQNTRQSGKKAFKAVGITNPTEQQLDTLQTAISTLETLSGFFSEETGAA